MTTQTKYYLMINGVSLTADLNLNTSGDPANVGYYSSHVEIDAALAANGTPGTLYTVGLFKEVVE